MTPRNILLIQGHPDASAVHLCHALADAYAQGMRPGFAFVRKQGSAVFTEKGLSGRSARVVVTLGMPALVYRWYFRAHSVRALQRNVLGFVGIAPVSETLVGNAAVLRAQGASRWLSRMRALGERCH